MSPEQIEGNPADPRADLYCLGLVLYEMLSGQPPFASESPRELLNLHCTQAPPRFTPALAGSLPPGLEALVFELLAKQPDQRPRHAHLVRDRLGALAGGSNHFNAPPVVPMHGFVPAGPAATAPVSHPSSMGTLMLVERAGMAQKRGRTVRLAAAIVGAVAVIGAVSAYFIWDRLVRTDRQAPSVVASEPAEPPAESKRQDTPEPPDEAEPDAEDEKRAEEVRERARREREESEEAVPPPDADDDESGDEGAEEDEEDRGLLRRFGIGREDPPEDPPDSFFGRLRSE
jgi:hypothetical protein